MRIIFWLVLLLSFSGYAQEYGPLPIDWQYLKAELHFAPEKKEVSGTVELTFSLEKPLDSAFIHGFKLDISSFEIDGEPVDFREADEQRIYFATAQYKPKKSHTIKIQYRANPTMGLFFAGWEDTSHTHVRQIYTHGQGNWHRRWLPLYDFPDDKYPTELAVTFDSAYQVLANGVLLEVTTQSSEKTWRFLQEKRFPPYVIALVIGKYEKMTIQTNSGIQIDQYAYPYWDDQSSEMYYRDTRQMFEFIEGDIGFPYPWGPYSVIPVSDYTYGGMENTGVSFVNDRYYGNLYDEFLRVNAHEMAHQWFGNCITAENDTHHWIQEGFATYYEWITNAEILGEEWFLEKLFNSEQMIINAAFEDSLPLADPKGSFERHYLRGAFTVHMLREMIGDEAFSKGMKRLFKNHQFEWANSTEVLNAFQKYTKEDLDVFRQQWVEKPGAPVFRMGVVDGKKGRIVAMESVTVRDWHDPAYEVDIPIHFYNETEHISSGVIQIENGTGYTELPENATHFEVDQNNRVLAYIIDLSPLELRMNCALYTQNPIVAYTKFERMVSRQDLLKTDSALVIHLMNHPSPVARQLLIGPTLKSEILPANRIITHFLSDTNKDVVEAVIPYIEEWTPEVEQIAAQILTQPGYAELKGEILEHKYSILKDDHTLRMWDDYSAQRGGLDRIRFLAKAYNHPETYDRDAVRNELVYYCSPAVNSYERELAFDVAWEWGEYNAEIVEHAKNATTNSARQLRQKAKAFLEEMEAAFPDEF